MTTDSRAENRMLLVTIGWIALVWILLAILVHGNSVARGMGGLAPVVLGADDGRAYYALARLQAFGTPLPEEIARAQGRAPKNLYPVLLGALMRLTGSDSVLLFKLLNAVVCLVGVWTAGHLVLRVAGRTLIGEPSRESAANARWLMIALGCYPSLCFFSFAFSLLRDAWVYTLFVVSSLLLLEVYTSDPGRRPRRVIAFFVALAALYLFRWYIAFVMLAACLPVAGFDLLAAWRDPRRRAGGFSKAFVLICLLVMGGILARRRSAPIVNSVQTALRYRENYRLVPAASESVAGRAPASATLQADRATVTQSRQPDGTQPPARRQPDGNLGIYYGDHPPASWPLLYGYSLLSNAFGPFVWQVKNTRMALAVPEGAAILALCFFLAAHRRQVDRQLGLLLVQAVCWLLLVGFMNDNLGTAMRLRVPSVMLLLVCAAVVRARLRDLRGDAGAVVSVGETAATATTPRDT